MPSPPQRLRDKSDLENLDHLATQGLNLATEINRLMEKMDVHPVCLADLIRDYATIKKWCEDNA